METVFVRLKALDPRRGHVLKRYTYKGIKFLVEKGWYRVTPAVADYLESVHQSVYDEVSPLAFEVATEAEARAIDEAARREEVGRRNAAVELQVTAARGERQALTTADLQPGGRGQMPAPFGADGGAPRPDAATPAAESADSAANAAKGRKDKGA